MTAAPSTPLVRRRDDLGFDADAIPRWWLHENPVLTHFANGLHLIFPEGERFFIRSVKRCLDQVKSEHLRERVQGFFGQEGEHGRQHGRVIALLRAQGYDVDAFLVGYEKMFRVLEPRVPARFCLAVTAALEHLTATLGASALEDDFLDGAAPPMKELFRWHAAEEIEHKSVAFDVLREVGVTWPERVLGMVVAVGGLVFFERRALRILMKQENLPDEARARFRRQALALRGGHQRRLFSRAFLEYAKPGFHPDDIDDRHLVESVFAAARS